MISGVPAACSFQAKYADAEEYQLRTVVELTHLLIVVEHACPVPYAKIRLGIALIFILSAGYPITSAFLTILI